MKKLARTVAVSIAVATLFGCGGSEGGGDGAIPPQALREETAVVPTVISECPENYKSINLENSSISNATMALKVSNATFSFKTPAGKMPSLKICFGLAPVEVIDGGIYKLSETYDLKVYPATGLINPETGITGAKIEVDFDFTAVPAGTTYADRRDKVHLFSDVNGTLEAATQTYIAFDEVNKSGTVSAKPVASGRYVVAFKQ